MNLTKDKKKGTWYVQFYYTDWQGNRKKKFKRGFKTKSEAQEWAMNFLQRQKGDTSLTFGQFIDEYYEDMEKRLKGNTMKTKKYIIEFKIRPFFANKVLSEITPLDIRKWQNELLGKGYKQTYLKTVNNQLSAMFNYAVNFRGLPSNPCRKAGSIGKGRAEEMKFWTLDEYKVFIEGAKDKEVSYIAFQMLYWSGMRIGELLALTYKDVDLETRRININKSFQRIDGKDVISTPKTEKSKRQIKIPKFLGDDLEEYFNSLYGIMPTDRIFSFTKSYLTHEMERIVKKTGVKKIRLHDLRHSHASLLINKGCSPLEVKERLGHEKIETTLNTYSHLYPDSQDKLVDMLEDL